MFGGFSQNQHILYSGKFDELHGLNLQEFAIDKQELLVCSVQF